MEQLKVTQGEWQVNKKTSQISNRRRIDVDNKTIFVIEDYTENEEEAKANAHLIAASKDLFEALKKVREYMTAHIPEKIFDEVDAALNKVINF